MGRWTGAEGVEASDVYFCDACCLHCSWMQMDLGQRVTAFNLAGLQLLKVPGSSVSAEARRSRMQKRLITTRLNSDPHFQYEVVVGNTGACCLSLLHEIAPFQSGALHESGLSAQQALFNGHISLYWC